MPDCARCGEARGELEFGLTSTRSAGKRKSVCKHCVNARKREKYRTDERYRRACIASVTKVDADRRRQAGLRTRLRQFGMTVADWESLYLFQGSGCAICRRPDDGSKRLAVDHCHETGRVRGLLCTRCNAGIGFFQDDPKLVSLALAYLTDEPSNP